MLYRHTRFIVVFILLRCGQLFVRWTLRYRMPWSMWRRTWMKIVHDSYVIAASEIWGTRIDVHKIKSSVYKTIQWIFTTLFAFSTQRNAVIVWDYSVHLRKNKLYIFVKKHEEQNSYVRWMHAWWWNVFCLRKFKQKKIKKIDKSYNS